jgi:hypothetical protein
MRLSTAEVKNNRPTDGIQDLNASSSVWTSNQSTSSATGVVSPINVQYAVFCSSKQARVIDNEKKRRRIAITNEQIEHVIDICR